METCYSKPIPYPRFPGITGIEIQAEKGGCQGNCNECAVTCWQECLRWGLGEKRKVKVCRQCICRDF